MKKYLIILILLFILPFTVLADSYLTDSVAGSATNTLKNFLNIGDEVTIINFNSVDEYTINNDYIDLSRDLDNSVRAKIDSNELNIEFKGKLVLPVNCKLMFYGLNNIVNINGLTNFDTSNVTSMSAMFHSCYALEKIDLASFDVSKVTTFQQMFQDCHNIKELDFSSFVTTNLTSLWCAFQYCYLLESIDMSNFNTSNVNDFSQMLAGCKKLKSIDLSNFDFSKTKKIDSMFYGCEELVSIDFSMFNASSVSMVATFCGCTKLKTIYVNENFSSITLTKTSFMFDGSINLVGGSGKKFDPSIADGTYANYETGYLTLAPTVTLKSDSNLFGNILKISKNIFSNVKELFSSNNDWDHNDNDIINTGETVSIMSDDNIFRTYIISYSGDTNGDGKINYIDYVRVYNHINNKKRLNKEYLISADYNNDNVVNNSDYSKIYSDIKK